MLRIEHNVIGMCGTNTYYVFNENTGEAIIVDPAGDHMRIIDRVKKLNIKPVGILITHGHFDHILALDDIRSYFGIKVYAGATERAVLRDSTVNLSAAVLGQGYCAEADIYLKDEEMFELAGYKIQALEVPGHTIGGMCYYFVDEGVVFSGDTLFNESIGRTDFPGGSMSALINGIKSKLFALDDNTVVYPGHAESTSIGREKKYNPFIR